MWEHMSMKTCSLAPKREMCCQLEPAGACAMLVAMPGRNVTDPSVMLTHKVGPGLQDLQKRGQRILAEKNAEKAEENMWISQMVVAESLGELGALVKSRGSTN